MHVLLCSTSKIKPQCEHSGKYTVGSQPRQHMHLSNTDMRSQTGIGAIRLLCISRGSAEDNSWSKQTSA